MRVLSRPVETLFVGFGMLLVALCILAGISSSSKLAAAPIQCKVVIILDRSASIGDNWPTMRGQVMNLFDPSNLGSTHNISLAFWSFSHVPDVSGVNRGVNYNAPYHGYVDADDPVGANAFGNSLPTNQDDILGGQTNYEQGFGYDAGLPNTLGDPSDPTKEPISAIASQANVIAFLTDGAPNYPGGADGNSQAISAGFAARSRYGSTVPVIGGYVSADPSSTFVPVSMYQAINGNSDTTASNIGPLGFSSLTSYLKPRIQDACNIDLPDYSLTPIVNVDNTAVKAGDTVNYSYSVDNDTTDASSGTSSWQLYDVTIDPSVTGNPLNFTSPQSACTTTSGKPYCDNVSSCLAILAMVGGNTKGTCNPVPAAGSGTCGAAPSTSPGTGSNTFAPGSDTTFYSPPRCQTIDDLPLGTRICSLLMLRNAGTASNRISSAACVTVGKTPLVQIRSGDLRVGRYFSGDSASADPSAGVFTSRFKMSGSAVPNGRTYGSWVEYGILAPGSVQKIASLSGYAGQYGGYDDPLATAGCDKNINKMTFANLVTDSAHNTECGYYPDSRGLLPDTISALTSGPVVDPSLYTMPLALSATSPAGMYRNTANNATFDMTDGTLPKGKTVIVYVPQGTVNIMGNIQYDDDTYATIKEIPQLIVIAKNIRIKDSVTRVDAWLIANGDSSGGGSVNTCSGFVAPLSANVCNQQLRVNGPVMARELDLWRTKVYDAQCSIDTVSDCATVGDPAEIFNLAGSSLLWTQGYGSDAVRAQTTYTIEMPPYF